jgi:glycosyltransferase involved in cell wall biosynthesis
MAANHRPYHSGRPLQAGRHSQASQQGPILLFGNVAFGSMWQRCQQLALCLAEHTDVVYVEPNRSFLQSLRRRVDEALPDQALPSRLSLFRPGAGLPLGRTLGVVNRLNYTWTAAALLRFLNARGLGMPSVLIATYPDQVDCLDAFAGVPVLYDLMDEPGLFLRPWQQRRFARLHQWLLGNARVIVTSSQVLLARYGPHARQAVCIGNGVSDQLLAELPGAVPDRALCQLPGPRIGYVGMISHWFDFDAVRALAESNPRGTVILVGPVGCKLPRLPANVVLVGPIPHRSLAPVLRAFDVGLIPFRRSSAIDAVNPVKLYEYLAAGLPVLAAAFGELEHYSDFVTCYRSERDAVTALAGLLARPASAAERETRQSFARQHGWSARAEQLLQVVRQIQAPVAKARPEGRAYTSEAG